ncbi:hypothetical protein [Mycolicibacterium chitae]|uniref:Transmembrane protein n=1 Tax=Mycolicibacterium chitae TaxID=1792 RepID=A0A3S4RN93_MYCCI|nr:hypothetical protein [Mycolicibacterium chitae]MCV7107275.1 hypothetical protein [Mycolicibacterium chitae]VEG48371.1 Uncharacterised protein [Mycolicibacterium chitae]
MSTSIQLASTQPALSTPVEPSTDVVHVPAVADQPRLRVSGRPADLAAVGAVLGLFALIPLPPWLSALLLAGFIAVAPGAAILSWVSVPVRGRAGVTLALGMSAVTLVTVGAMWSYRWDPHGILVVGVVAVLGSSGLWYHRNGWPGVPTMESLRSTVKVPAVRLNSSLVLSIIALTVWAVSVPGLPGVDASLYGLLFSGTGPLIGVAIMLTTVSFALAIRARQLAAAVFALGSAITVSRVTTFVATEIPLYDWTYKHIAVVDYIQQHGLIMPPGTDIYTKWPSFFVAMTWFCDVTGLDPTTLAHVWTPVIHILISVVVYSAARAFGFSPLVAIAAAFVIEIVNWVGQDYFSPQSWALVMAIGLLTLLIRSREHRTAGILAILPFVAIVPTHQLTPYWLLLVTALLMIAKRVRPWWILLVMAAVAGGYLLMNLEAVAPYGLLSGTSPVKNAESNLGDAVGTPASWFTSAVCRSVSAAVFLIALGAAWWLRRNGRPVLVSAILAFCPLLMLLGMSYGGEAIFRVYLYSLLGLGFLIAPLLVWALERPARGRIALPAVAATLGMAVISLASLNSFVALWPFVYETKHQIALMEQITADARPGTRIMMMHPSGMPARIGAPYAEQTLKFPDFDKPISMDLGRDRAKFPTREQLGDLEWNVEQHPFDTYMIFSEQSQRAIEYYRRYRPEGVAEFREYLDASPKWEAVYRDGETVIYLHAGSGEEWWNWVAPEQNDALGIGGS